MRNSSGIRTATKWPDKSRVAEIPVGLVSELTRAELIRLIDVAELGPVDARTRARLSFLDRPTLKRMAHLDRLSCRNVDD
jgi:hypothetical protein